MSFYLCPDSAQKKFRYKASLARAGSSKHKGWTVWSNIKERFSSEPAKDHDTGTVLPLNKQFKLRFFGFLHQQIDHGPVRRRARWMQADYRFNAVTRSKRSSSRSRDRCRPYI